MAGVWLASYGYMLHGYFGYFQLRIRILPLFAPSPGLGVVRVVGRG